MKHLEPWKQRYATAHQAYQLATTPNAVKDFGAVATKFPDVETANGLEVFAINMFNWTGWHLERTKNMGRIKDNTKTYIDVVGRTRKIGSIEWQKGSGRKGSTDLKGHAKPEKLKHAVPVYIEVKAGKDRMRDEQKQYQEKVTSTGAFHLILKQPEDLFGFIDFLKSL